MGLKIIKLAVISETKIETSPTLTRYFYEISEPLQGGDSLRINAENFLDDSGNKVDSLPLLNLNNSYFNVFINGLLQMEDNFSYTAGEEEVGNLLIFIPEGSEISEGTPLILEVMNFNPVLSSQLET